MTQVFRITLVSLLAVSSLSCVAGAKLRADMAQITNKIELARDRGAYRCAPRSLAKAEAHLEFLGDELDFGDYMRADWHHRASLENINYALEVTDPKLCREKKVVFAEPEEIVIKVTDRDQDGVLDPVDKCVDVPEDMDDFEDEDGCPELDNDGDGVLDVEDACPLLPGILENRGCPNPDTDGDGIMDVSDQCPDEREDVDKFEDTDGCPDPDNDADTVLDVDDRCPLIPGDTANQGCPNPDRDGDGINNEEDGCPDDAEDRDYFEDADGCPDLDNDGDSVPDISDQCPLQPGSVNTGGCPQQDRDNDGVLDEVDQCPDVPGTQPVGCPARVLVKVTETHIEIKDHINFEFNKAIIKGATSFEILHQVAAALKSNPKIKVVIEGHTDSSGAADYNLQLSDDRAKAVREDLIDRGIAGNRLEAIGYGESRPMGFNQTSEGRAANRRVEFRIVKKASGK